ncbi:MAG: hypothetical protein U0531_00140 [Dehalococcoidia bacterium]
MNTRPLPVDRTDAWAIHDCLQAALAGFGGRHETAEPWHGINLLAKLRPALLEFEAKDAPRQLFIELTRGELECIDMNVPRTAYQGGVALLLRVFHALEELAFDLPLLGEEPDHTGLNVRLAAWRRDDRSDPSMPR